MEIIKAETYRDNIIALLRDENLPVDDLAAGLENFLVATEDCEVIGAVGLEYYNGYALLRSLAVKKDKRNAGVAGKVLSRIEDIARRNGIKEIFLLTETARDYFLKKGYSTINRTDVPAEVQHSSEFSHVCPKSAIVMKKSLQSALLK
jgi:amino-acid N-acetyltransferase